MTEDFFTGKLVELALMEPDKDTVAWESWNRDSDYLRLLDDNPATQFTASMIKEWFEKDDFSGTLFIIRNLDEHKPIGFIELNGYDWVDRSAWVGIGIGDADFRGKGYGTEAMTLMLKFAFLVQNLHRVNLGVFSFNPRAIRCYEKCGFKYEGVERDYIFKDDQYWDAHLMGILRPEWEALQSIK